MTKHNYVVCIRMCLSVRVCWWQYHSAYFENVGRNIVQDSHEVLNEVQLNFVIKYLVLQGREGGMEDKRGRREGREGGEGGRERER